MYNYKFNSIVSNSEQDALKEMIFKRARERAQAITDEVQSNYTTNIQNDIMELARNSFVSSKNPFSQLVETKKEEIIEEPKETDKTNTQEIGFAKRQINEIKSQINSKNNSTSADIANKEVELAMASARMDFTKKASFMGALEFLNSQASIALVKNKGKSFEAMA